MSKKTVNKMGKEHLHILDLGGGRLRAFIHIVDCGTYVATESRLWPGDDLNQWDLRSACIYLTWMRGLLDRVANGRELRFLNCNVGGAA